MEVPPVYLWNGAEPHPQRNRASGEINGKTYIFMIDASNEGKQLADHLAHAQKVPLGRDADVRDLGAYTRLTHNIP